MTRELDEYPGCCKDIATKCSCPVCRGTGTVERPDFEDGTPLMDCPRCATAFGAALKKAREDDNLSQREAAELISQFLPLATLQNWEQGRNLPPLWAQELILQRLAEE